MTVKKACPLCEKEFNWLSSHLKHKHNLMSAEERAPHLRFSKDAAMKRGDTVLNSVVDDDTLTQFEEQKRNLSVEFQDIEDQIVWFYLMTKPLVCSTKDIRETIQTHLMPLYTMVRDSLETSMYIPRVQMKNDVVPPNVKRMKTLEVTDDDQNIADNETVNDI